MRVRRWYRKPYNTIYLAAVVAPRRKRMRIKPNMRNKLYSTLAKFRRRFMARCVHAIVARALIKSTIRFH